MSAVNADVAGDREDLHVVAHVKHHPPRGEHRAQRQQDRENREAAQLESNGGQQTKKGCESEPDPEGRERDDKCVRDHAASLYPMPQTVSRYFGSDGSSSSFSRKRRTWTVTVPVSSAAVYPHTRAMSWSLENTRRG